MDDAALRRRLWDGFARLQTLLGGHAGAGSVLDRDGVVASVVPGAPESPTLNAAVAIVPEAAPERLGELSTRYRDVGVRRWGLWLDSGAGRTARELKKAGMTITTASPGMGARLDELRIAPTRAQPADLTTVGRVNDLAYGNVDARLERTLAPLPNSVLLGFRADLPGGQPAAVATALLHDGDCGVSFVATIPEARRRGFATVVMHQALTRARERGCTTTTLQATDAGERLYVRLGYRRLCMMQLWERASTLVRT